MAVVNLSDFLRRLTRQMGAETLVDQSDRQLVERALAGRDEAAFEAIVHRHGVMVYRVCWRVLQHPQDAEDAFQVTFLILAQKIRTVRKHASLASWLHGVAHRVAVRAKTQSATRRRRESLASIPDVMPPDDITWKEFRSALDASGFASDVTALTFSPDGTTLVAGLRDTTLLVWDIGKASPQLAPSLKLSADELESRWADLISDNPGQAFQAIGGLVAAPRQAVPFLRDRVKPTPVADEAKIQRWIADLDSASFAVRKLAGQELVKADTQVKTPIQKALKGAMSLESRRRLEKVLSTLSDVPDASTVRLIRAILVLERTGSPDARVILESLARGAPGARVTEEARGALSRIDKR